MNALHHWHALVKTRELQGLDALLADEVVFYSPVLGTPQVGKAVTKAYLTAALHVLANDTFRYVREVAGENDAVLEFECVVDGVRVNGVDILHWNAAQQLTEFKVMLRPLKAVHWIQEKIAAMLAQGKAS
jgi:SnoaL-like domain